jgi:hypothetical protein
MSDTISKRHGKPWRPEEGGVPDSMPWFWVLIAAVLTGAFIWDYLSYDSTPGKPVQIFVYSHTKHECVVEAYVNGVQVWSCDDGCSYTGRWQSDIEHYLNCPKDGSHD